MCTWLKGSPILFIFSFRKIIQWLLQQLWWHKTHRNTNLSLRSPKHVLYIHKYTAVNQLHAITILLSHLFHMKPSNFQTDCHFQQHWSDRPADPPDLKLQHKLQKVRGWTVGGVAFLNSCLSGLLYSWWVYYQDPQKSPSRASSVKWFE